ncbi:unnamed protein product [Chrysoparadoxa australica]
MIHLLHDEVESARELMKRNQPFALKTDVLKCKGLEAIAKDLGCLDNLSRELGGSSVPVCTCETDPVNSSMTLHEYIMGYLPKQDADAKEPKHYLKDWHFIQEHGKSRYEDYSPPSPVLQDDWLNDWCDIQSLPIKCPLIPDCLLRCQDYRFVYLGPRGTFTPLHHDVLGSYSWSVNVTGRKRWILFPPHLTHLLKDKNGELAFDVRAEAWDLERFPGLAEACAAAIDVVQGEGECIFVPSFWHHQVVNLGHVTLSINHNFFNGYNIKEIFKWLASELGLVRRELAHLRQEMESEGKGVWEDKCEELLRLNSKMGMGELVSLLWWRKMCRGLTTDANADYVIGELEEVLREMQAGITSEHLASISVPLLNSEGYTGTKMKASEVVKRLLASLVLP